jgi:hypothetical protein
LIETARNGNKKMRKNSLNLRHFVAASFARAGRPRHFIPPYAKKTKTRMPKNAAAGGSGTGTNTSERLSAIPLAAVPLSFSKANCTLIDRLPGGTRPESFKGTIPVSAEKFVHERPRISKFITTPHCNPSGLTRKIKMRRIS